MNRYLFPVLFLILIPVQWAQAQAAFAQKAWLGRVPDFEAVCSRKALDLEDPDSAAWIDLQERLLEEEGNLGAWLVLPAEASSLETGDAGVVAAENGPRGHADGADSSLAMEPAVPESERLPCAQYFGSGPLPEGVIGRTVPGGPALFSYCPGASPAPCYARLRELLQAGGLGPRRLIWSRSVLGWVDEEGRPYQEPAAEDLEAASTDQEVIRESPDARATLDSVGFVVVAYVSEDEVSEIIPALSLPMESEDGG